MCGRFVRKGEPKKVAQDLIVVAGEENWTTSYNVAPGSTIPIIMADPAGGPSSCRGLCQKDCLEVFRKDHAPMF